ncbi:MAG: hypothetical protein HN350_19085 [Phycisphaerales bacterium]|nr:hypothetical protein [Phycisphaerales bacterium]
MRTDNMTLDGARRRVVAAGFTLAEVLIMVMVIIIAGSIVIPYLGSSNYSVARAGARRMASDLQYAQETAISTQKDITVTFDLDNETYWLSNESGVLIHPITSSKYATNYKAVGELSHLKIATLIANGVKIASGRGSVTFDSSGVPDVSGTVVLQAGESTFYVTLSAVTGTVTVAAED